MRALAVSDEMATQQDINKALNGNINSTTFVAQNIRNSDVSHMPQRFQSHSVVFHFYYSLFQFTRRRLFDFVAAFVLSNSFATSYT